MKHLNASPLILIVASFCTIFFSCNSKKSIPFPDNASGYKTPVTKSFKFPEAKPIIWKEISKDSVPKGKTVAFDLDRLPSQPFTLNDFKPLKSPVEKIELDWDNLKEHPINLDTIKGVPFKIKSFLLIQ